MPGGMDRHADGWTLLHPGQAGSRKAAAPARELRRMGLRRAGHCPSARRIWASPSPAFSARLLKHLKSLGGVLRRRRAKELHGRMAVLGLSDGYSGDHSVPRRSRMRSTKSFQDRPDMRAPSLDGIDRHGVVVDKFGPSVRRAGRTERAPEAGRLHSAGLARADRERAGRRAHVSPELDHGIPVEIPADEPNRGDQEQIEPRDTPETLRTWPRFSTSRSSTKRASATDCRTISTRKNRPGGRHAFPGPGERRRSIGSFTRALPAGIPLSRVEPAPQSPEEPFDVIGVSGAYCCQTAPGSIPTGCLWSTPLSPDRSRE